MTKAYFLKHTLLFVVGILLFGCPRGQMSGSEFRNSMRDSVSNEPEDIQGRVRRGTNGFRDIDPNGVVDEFLEPCHQCDDDAASGREVRRSSNNLERNFRRMGGDPKALAHAMCFFYTHRNTRFISAAGGRVSIQENCKIAINDYANTGVTQPKKMFIVNRCTGTVDVMNVARGKGGYSNGIGSRGTPDGFHITGGWHYGPNNKTWYPGIKMHGLQRGINNNTYGRGVVIHRALNSSGRTYCTGGYRSSNRHRDGRVGGYCGRTYGCPGVDPNNWSKVVDDLKGNNSGGALVYNYTPRMKQKSPSYCGDNLWR